MDLTSVEIRLCQESPEFKLATVANCERTDEYMARTNVWYDCGGAEAVDADDVDASLQSLAREFVADAAASGALIDLAESESYVRARWAEHIAAEAARTCDDRRAALRGQWAAEAFEDAHYSADD